MKIIVSCSPTYYHLSDINRIKQMELSSDLHTLSIAKICMCYLYVLGDVLSLCSWNKCLCVGSRLEPEGNQPADEDDSGLKEALLGAVQRFTAILLPSHHTVVGLRTHLRYV